VTDVQVLIGPHGGNLQNLVYMRQPGYEGVAAWKDDDTYAALFTACVRCCST
jgi:hypothetical protein